MKNMIETHALTKQYKKQRVVSELDLAVPEGCIYGFLGPNGAGKSTTMKMILGLVKPTGGQIRVLGQNADAKNRIALLRSTGSLIESPAFYGHLTGRENLSLIADLKQTGKKEVDDVLRTVRLTDAQHKKASRYSLGMKQRLGFAAALLGHPKLLLLDEPTNGLDPAGIQEMRELIRRLCEQHGITVFVSSHLLSEIDQMANHVGIINHGVLIFQDRLSALHEHSRARMLLRTTEDETALRILKQAALPCTSTHGGLYLNTAKEADILRAGTLLFSNGLGILSLAEEQKSLEDIFLELTGRSVM